MKKDDALYALHKAAEDTLLAFESGKMEENDYIVRQSGLLDAMELVMRSDND